MTGHSPEHIEDASLSPAEQPPPELYKPVNALQSGRLSSIFLVPASKILDKGRHHWVFILIVILPTLLMALYLWFVATPQYISETHFLVRGKSQSASGLPGLSSLIESSHGGSEDTYAAQDYMTSRDAMEMLVKNVSLKEIYNRPYADFLARFPSILTRKDSESFYKYYKRHIKAQINEENGISYLTVRAFSPKDSQHVAQTLLDAAEKLVNEMNERQRRNTIGAAQEELIQTFKDLHDTEMQMAEYRYQNEIIDPIKQATPMVGTALSLETSLSMLRAEKAQLDKTAPGSPLRQVYAQRIASLQEQVNRAQSHITGQHNPSLVVKLKGYDELDVQRQIIEKKLAAETNALEIAKEQADRQMLYVTVVARPSLPDYPQYPRDTIWLIVTFVTALGAYITGSLLISGAREHALQ